MQSLVHNVASIQYIESAPPGPLRLATTVLLPHISPAKLPSPAPTRSGVKGREGYFFVALKLRLFQNECASTRELFFFTFWILYRFSSQHQHSTEPHPPPHLAQSQPTLHFHSPQTHRQHCKYHTCDILVNPPPILQLITTTSTSTVNASFFYNRQSSL